MFHGVLAPLATPFDRTGALQLDAFCRNLSRYLETRLTGFVVAGTTGEGLHLLDSEKIQLVEQTSQLLPRERHFLVGVPAPSLRQALVFGDRLQDFPIDGLLVTVPSYYRSRMTKAALLNYFESLADRTPFPIYLYNIPQLTGIELPPSVVQELAAHPRIAGMKESSGNLIYLQEILGVTGNEDFQVMSGSAETFAFARQLGVEAAILGASCVIPDLLVEHAEGSAAPDATFRVLQRKIARFSSLVVRGLGVAGIKAAMDLRGYEGLYCRRPLEPLTEAEQERVREGLEQIVQP